MYALSQHAISIVWLLPHLMCRSSVPSAFTGYSFHVIEAVIVFANEVGQTPRCSQDERVMDADKPAAFIHSQVFVCWLLPHHIGLHRVYHLLTTMIHEGEVLRQF
jgi:hypothetical protein